ncbi:MULTISPECIES: UbiA-like polyprenyltransferase [Oceanotoga]|jgi:4-hydroxybenzoate polyprenyltransferase|uniref:4-hydroxybenzoate polyprenyltransferase n=1 Tax=Oceanotoga teriensis TaxID=515440 RepID=A0AA45C6A7_9BACT|nr:MULTISPECIES: UbiA-like polyprenyltransferase [Oceanotoga]MDN5343490.1 4-hydroxybenzoate polyprenyltransferase [Oceanotoga sp.]MDO7975764.1 putative 4-hydroxybenzoate polyprenyltransferase [Oceanotoga teriensis]PWJ91258.1 4-hydroxybenzoate polyprenyltransferase [Oceanotoga teriensis]
MVLSKLKTYGELVMFSHTLFSLPFALISMFWAANGLPNFDVFLWIVIALFGARNGANALNRIIDAEIDKKNPRTKDRHIPKGKVKKREALLIVIFCFVIMEISAYMLNPLCLYLSPLAIAIFVIYSYTKRFTWLCHIILGIACGGAPVGAWIAVKGTIDIVPILLGAVVTAWVGGFDIIYATQDYNFDKENKLHSIPVFFGIKGSLIISSLMHIFSIGILFLLYYIMNMGIFYLIGLIIISILLFIEHKMVSPKDLKSMKIASYSINQIVSVLFLIFTSIDIFF